MYGQRIRKNEKLLLRARACSETDFVSAVRLYGGDPSVCLVGEDLSHINFISSDISGISFCGACLDYATFDKRQLESVINTGPISLNGVRVLDDKPGAAREIKSEPSEITEECGNHSEAVSRDQRFLGKYAFCPKHGIGKIEDLCTRNFDFGELYLYTVAFEESLNPCHFTRTGLDAQCVILSEDRKSAELLSTVHNAIDAVRGGNGKLNESSPKPLRGEDWSVFARELNRFSSLNWSVDPIPQSILVHCGKLETALRRYGVVLGDGVTSGFRVILRLLTERKY
ncbi:hypothetical protein [Pseudoroseicyclus tamaricis]|uniref:Uncharacterized protein n=1 Tax=Pseudoroseicyclus tamaricis TaxID=2705421 RepID=A0A6B2K0H0_9RHOB|nr:hypothetical protein [Pseudoroseicyclus tamaricis]NDV02439.1 hypothetical protein [Pseudoroseicyclus tamaricis]